MPIIQIKEIVITAKSDNIFVGDFIGNKQVLDIKNYKYLSKGKRTRMTVGIHR